MEKTVITKDLNLEDDDRSGERDEILNLFVKEKRTYSHIKLFHHFHVYEYNNSCTFHVYNNSTKFAICRSITINDSLEEIEEDLWNRVPLFHCSVPRNGRN